MACAAPMEARALAFLISPGCIRESDHRWSYRLGAIICFRYSQTLDRRSRDLRDVAKHCQTEKEEMKGSDPCWKAAGQPCAWLGTLDPSNAGVGIWLERRCYNQSISMSISQGWNWTNGGRIQITMMYRSDANRVCTATSSAD